MGKYRIKTVVLKTGIRKVTLQAWERRYQVVSPKRTASGYRLYSEKDVQKLLALKQLIRDGHSISEAIQLLQLPPQTTSKELLETSSSLLRALACFNRSDAIDIITPLQNCPYSTLIHDLYFPLLTELDAGIISGKYSIVQEHFTSGFVRDQLVAIFLQINQKNRSNKVITACFPEDLHDIGLLALSIELAEQGNQIIFLGARVPLDDLILCCQQQQPTLLCLSYNALTSYDVRSYLSTLRSSIPLSIPIYLGGAAIHSLSVNIEGIHTESPLQRIQ